jgi:hypothetical protein
LSRGVTITEPNHVWATDITYIPMEHGFSLARGGYRLGQPGGSGVAIVEHHGRQLLHRRARRSLGALRQAEDFQH